MRAAASLLVAGLFCAGAVQGQQQSVTLQMQCRNLNGTGNYMAADESYVNGMACRPVSSGAAGSASAAEATTVAQNQPFAATQAYAYASAPVLGSGSVRNAVASGPSVYIEPMQGLDGLLSVALDKKHVPLMQVVSDAHATYVLHFSWGSQNADSSKAGDKHASHADETPSLQLVERSTGVVVFAYPLNRANTWHGERSAAEAFASQVKEQVAKR
jgi:hypothetical protein